MAANFQTISKQQRALELDSEVVLDRFMSDCSLTHERRTIDWRLVCQEQTLTLLVVEGGLG